MPKGTDGTPLVRFRPSGRRRWSDKVVAQLVRQSIPHGRALLAVRIPATRHAITTSADAAEICEHYSLAVLYRRPLVAKGSSSIYIAEYDLLMGDLETEAAGILV